MKRQKQFSKGDMVEWPSTAAGITRLRVGEVVDVIRKNRDVDPTRYTRARFDGGPRDHVSYVVHVPGRGHYWPHVQKLRKAKRGRKAG